MGTYDRGNLAKALNMARPQVDAPKSPLSQDCFRGHSYWFTKTKNKCKVGFEEESPMCTVSQLCEALARAANMPLVDVKKYARALINSGDLPKAVGRSIPKMDMRHRAKLILAVAASERPSDCVIPMRERYDAVSRFRDTDMTAGELLAGELEELASESFEAFQKWTYSQLEVSRGGMPKVRFLINENLRHFSRSEAVEQPEFLGGPWLAVSNSEIEEFHKKNEGKGLAVSAFVPGRVLWDVAFGSREAADNAMVRVKNAHKESQNGNSE